MSTPRQLLTAQQIHRKIRRIAFEMYEHNLHESSVILAGVAGEGHQLATLLAEQLRAISPLQVHLVALQFEKTLPHQSAIHLSDPTLSIANQNVVIVDDVLNTGRTLAFALAPFLAVPIRKLQVAVLVNRGHRLYPVSADFVGYSLSTTFDDHIQVRLGAEHEQQGVFLVRS